MEIRSMSLGSWALGMGKAESPPGFEVPAKETEIKQEAIETSQNNVKEQTINEPNAQSTKPDFHTKRPVRVNSSDAELVQVPSSDQAHLAADVSAGVTANKAEADSAAFVAAAELVASQYPVPPADIHLDYELAPTNWPQSVADIESRIEHLNKGTVKGAVPTLIAAFQALSADVAHLAGDFVMPKFEVNQTVSGAQSADVHPQGSQFVMPAGSADMIHHSADTSAGPTKQFAPVPSAPAFEESHVDVSSAAAGVAQTPIQTSESTPMAFSGVKSPESDSALPPVALAPSSDVNTEADLAAPAPIDVKSVLSVDLADLPVDVSGQVVNLPIDPDLQLAELVSSGDLEHVSADVAQIAADEAMQAPTMPVTGAKVNADIAASQAANDKAVAPSTDVHAAPEDGFASATDLAVPVKAQPESKPNGEPVDFETRSIDFVERSTKNESADSKSGSWSRFDAPFLREQASVKATQNVPAEMPKLTDVQVKNVISQVIDRAEALAASRPKNGVTIHLRPQELGSITLFVKRTGTADVEAQMYASNDQVREALESNRGMLLHSLESKGLNVAAVTVTDSPFDAGANGSADSRTLQHGQHQARGGTQFVLGNEVKGLDVEAIRQRIRSASGVDIWI